MLDRIEEFMNTLTDMDWGWWPFLFLRPAKDVEITTLHLAKMSLYYGPITGIFLSFVLGVLWASLVAPLVVLFLLILASILFGVISFFIGYGITFAYFWNRRARRLQNYN